MSKKMKNRSKNNVNEEYEKTVRSLAGLGIFPLAYFIAFFPEMEQWKRMVLFAVIMLSGNAALIRNHRANKYLTPMLGGLFILGTVLNIAVLGGENIVVLGVVGVVFTMKLRTLGKFRTEMEGSNKNKR